MIATSDFRKGIKILLREAPYIVVDFQHVKPGKGGAFVRTKLKNLITGLILEETFRSGEKFPSPDLEQRAMQYLYVQDGQYNFMDQESFEQLVFTKQQLGDVVDYLKEQALYSVLYFEGRPIAVTPPLFMELAIVETTPGVKGDTAQGAGNKAAKLESGLVVQVPLFLQEGDVVKVDTRDASYVERVKN